MKGILNSSEIIGTLQTPQGEAELCASADAEYEQGDRKLAVRLDVFARLTSIAGKEQRVSLNWLPRAQTVTENVSIEEAGEVARDIFRRWVRKIREAAPALHHATF